MEVTFAAYPHEITKNAHQVSDITQWVFKTYGDTPFDSIVGHSMGGFIALELAALYPMKCDSILFIESNLRPANAFYRNLMLPDHMAKYGADVKRMFVKEAPFYTDDLRASIQSDFDFTPYIRKISGKIFGIYGDRGIENYTGRIADLCLDKAVEDRIQFKFVRNSCHLPMIESPQDLAGILRTCLT